MPEAGYLLQVIIILAAAVVGASLFRKLGLESTLGYLVAGVAIGPAGFALITEFESTHALAELGVVFLLFTVGLELPFERLRVMRGLIFGLGAAQVFICAIVIAAIAHVSGLSLPAALIVGAGLSLSSTAIILRMLSARGELTSRLGRSALAVLLMQDLSVAPFLVVSIAFGSASVPLAEALSVAVIKAVIAVLAVLGLGRILLSHLLRPIAAVREPEVFAALTLAIVLGAGWLTQEAGLSMALGAFLAGMLFAGTQYRLQVAAEIQPFRGLLLGLFFITVGMGVNLSLIWQEAGTIALSLFALLLIKTALIAGLARLFRFPIEQAVYLGFLLGAGGEFAFVLLGSGMVAGSVPQGVGQLLITVVALSMMIAPLMAAAGRWILRRQEAALHGNIEDAADSVEALSGHVVIAGFGRVGRAVARRFVDEGTPYIAVDLNPTRIGEARGRGDPVYYGDAARPEILELLHVERAKAVVVAVDNARAALQIVAMLHYIFPKLKVYARAQDDEHAEDLRRAGAHVVIPELVATGSQLATSALAEASAEP